MERARKSPLLLGHRGARAIKSIPENTVASFDQALADGCDGFEFDVRLTGDGAAVICHDAESSGIEIARASVEDLPGLPLLEDVLARYQDRAFLDVELKVSGLEKITVELLRRYPARRGVVVSSFLPEVLRDFRKLEAQIPLGLICETKAELRRWSELPGEYVIPHYKLATASVIRELKAGAKKVVVWTVNGGEEMRRFVEDKVDGIISDDTSLLRRTVESLN
jgi:glycerophosphoryl diester phosphodiesterase